MYMYMYLYVYVYIYKNICIYIWLGRLNYLFSDCWPMREEARPCHRCIYTNKCVYLYMSIYIYMYLYVYVYIYKKICIYIYMARPFEFFNLGLLTYSGRRQGLVTGVFLYINVCMHA